MTAVAPFGALLADGWTCLAFFSRLPVPTLRPLRPFGVAIRVLPVAALLIGACGGLPLVLADRLGLPHAMAAILAVAAGLRATGGLHEDGLADTADGLGGGTTPAARLAIMRDSRIGTYGVLALAMALAWRIAALTALLDRVGAPATAYLMLAASAVSRPLALLPLALLPPARPDGLGHGVGPLDPRSLGFCAGMAALLGVLLPMLAGLTLSPALLACVAAAAAAWWVTRLARRSVGGHTGDIAGACQQAAEAGYLLGVIVLPR